MKNKILNVVGAVGSFGLAFGLVTGHVQEVINFTDSLNEMVMCALALMLGVLFTIAVFDKTK
jgi:predicted Co/Zn/Cd cation transporter (cation efflux family)